MDRLMKDRALSLVTDMLNKFYCHRDIEGVLSCLSREASWIGPGEKEVKFTYEEIRDYFLRGKEEIPACVISDEDLRVVYCDGTCCMVAGSVTIRSGEQSEMLVEARQRVSFLIREEDGDVKVAHMHLSNPYMEMAGEEYFPKAMGTQSYQYLQRLLHEKTEVINMINSNITGGLKGSNDDDTFSFFYVNEGLPAMLGYTYEEFMERSGGTAVGAVYPPDLPGALKAVDECFARGPVYSAEYRIEKKDGSLMWVMDSGRKTIDSNGEVKINSIITDITPLKQALFDLEVERERYRIALENITDVMCEYDIQNDVYTTFHRMEADGKSALKKLEIPEFSKEVLRRKMIHPEDWGKFMDLFSGRREETIEIRTRGIQEGSGWRWSQISCSVIRDSSRIPVKTIGMLKDTELIHQAQYDGLTHLLNQMETRRCVEEYLDAEGRHGTLAGAMMILDLDQFKQVNDTKGHLFGNQVLKEAAAVLLQNVGDEDLAGRIGGDEFLLLVKQGSKEEITARADRMIQDIKAAGERLKTEISCSIGIVFLEDGEMDYEELFHRADQALYRAKRSGRKRWMVDERQP